MLHQCLFLAALCLSHAFGTRYYYSVDGPDDHEKDEAHYEFRYGVRDYETGDIKNQWEVRKGDKVKGEYSLVEPDGTLRIVQYSADKKNGFNAVVTKEGKSRHPSEKRQHFKPNSFDHANELSDHEEADRGFGRGLRPRGPAFYPPTGYQVIESQRKTYYSLSDVPPNHSPVYTGVSDYNKLVNMYRNFRKQTSDAKKHKFDYGINQYFENGFVALNHRTKYEDRYLNRNSYWGKPEQ